LELSNDVDKLLADTVDAAFASFKTDKLTVDHISFMKKLISLDTPTAKGTAHSTLASVSIRRSHNTRGTQIECGGHAWTTRCCCWSGCPAL
jgi:hypothetical protein